MRKLTNTLLICAALVGFMSCSAEAPSKAGIAEAASADSVVCCGGNCDAPAGYCCGDGTCGGNHAELPQVAKN
jgi:hypothetical protein